MTREEYELRRSINHQDAKSQFAIEGNHLFTPLKHKTSASAYLAKKTPNRTRKDGTLNHQVENVNKRAPASSATKASFRGHAALLPTVSQIVTPRPRHDPAQEGALVMTRPSKIGHGKSIVDVVVDPFLSRHLREHQRLGVAFLYECIMGMRDNGGEGAILADEMGLGKTLQTIALLWTLMKQNPIYGDPPVVKKALVVCPVSLVHNWRKEFRKWLGNERIGVFVPDEKYNRITDFTMGKSYNVMIIGYERLRIIQEQLQAGSGVDIVIADEGHRLKTAQNKSALAIKSLNTERRIILSGTPIQNDLSEFFTMVDFVNPGLLGKYSAFKRQFEDPIVKSRQPAASVKDTEAGELKNEELASITSKFILRRNAEILAHYLPPKTEFILFCKPTPSQTVVYRKILSSPAYQSVLGSSESALQLISILKKVCNSPSLLDSTKPADDGTTSLVKTLLSEIPQKAVSSPGVSAKVRVLDSILHHIRTSTEEKVVIISNYTTTLDIIERLLTANSYSFLRLDGSTQSAKRQSLVDRFNKTPASSCFAFLLSAKSGGVGLNLIGASRLILFDLDWNPATDLQAMARIHRDGQQRACHIYRLLVKGALDEKIYQRQITKQGLADAIVDQKVNVGAFTREELQNLFTLDEVTDCQTHHLLGCACGGLATPAQVPSPPNEPEDDDEPPLLELPLLLKASEVDMEAQELRIREQTQKSNLASSKDKFGALMKYIHIDVTKLSNCNESTSPADEETTKRIIDVIDDEVMTTTLREDDCRIAYIFLKKNLDDGSRVLPCQI